MTPKPKGMGFTAEVLVKIYVCLKQIPDTEAKIKFTTDGMDETSVTKWMINPYDEYAIEEALQVAAKHQPSTVTLISVGPKIRVSEALRSGLAMGADEAIVVDAPSMLDQTITAKIIAKLLQKESSNNSSQNIDIIFTGKVALDDNASCVSQMIAEYLGLPHVTSVIKFQIDESINISETKNQTNEQSHNAFIATVERESDGSKEKLSVNLPAVFGATKGLNTPRYISLPGIMKAKKKPLREIDFSSLQINAEEQKIKYIDFKLPTDPPPVKMIQGDASQQAQQLISFLKNEAKIL